MTGRHPMSLRALLLAAALASPAALHAQQQTASNDTGVEAVVITAPHYVPDRNTSATKSNVSILKTPQSVTVITRDQITVLNWQTTQQAVRYTAGVDGENFGPDQRYDYVTVRGFYPVEYIDGLQAPIAPANSLNDIGVDLWGFDSIEILKGPASVLYGESPPGGLLNLTSRRPQDAFHGTVQGQYGSYDSWEVAGDVTGPITNGLDGRLTALYFDKGTQLDFEKHRRIYVAPALTWHINPDTKMTYLSFYQSDHDAGCCGGFLPEQGTLLPNPNGVIPSSRNFGEPGYNVYTRDEAGIGYEFQHSFNANWSLEQDFKYFYLKDNTKEIYGAGLEGDLQTEEPQQLRVSREDPRVRPRHPTQWRLQPRPGRERGDARRRLPQLHQLHPVRFQRSCRVWLRRCDSAAECLPSGLWRADRQPRPLRGPQRAPAAEPASTARGHRPNGAISTSPPACVRTGWAPTRGAGGPRTTSSPIASASTM